MNRAVVLVAISAGIVGTSYGMYSPLVPVFSRDVLHAGYSEIGAIGMANYVPYMFAPLIVGSVLDRTNKSLVLGLGISLAGFSAFMLSGVQSVPEMILFRLLAGVAHAMFWPSSEALVTSNSEPSRRVRGIAIFTAAWVLGFMLGPLAGKLVLDAFDFRTLFQVTALVMAAAIVPAVLVAGHGRPAPGRTVQVHFGSLAQVGRQMVRYPAASAVLLYYAVTFGVVLSVYPAYMGESSISSQEIEYLFFVFGASRFATLYFVPRVAKYGKSALALAVAATSLGMLIPYISTSAPSFAVSLALIGAATSVFYPLTFGMVTRNVPADKMGQQLGAYESVFGIGWAAGPLIVGLSSDSFGSAAPYLALFVVGGALAATLAAARRK